MRKQKKKNIPLTQWEIDNLYTIVHTLAVKRRESHTELTLFTKEEDRNYKEIDENLKIACMFGRLEEALEPYINREYLEENNMV